MATNCNRCHGGGESPNLTTQSAVQSNRDSIDKQAAAGPNATNTYMPEGGSVSLEERQKLGEWLACGAP
jgi:mono/diheme cytochrome c family protein